MNHAILTANVWTMGLNLIYAVVTMLIGVVALRLMDKLVFPEIDFVQEIKRGNIASAVFAGMILLFLAIVLSGAVR